MFFYKWFNLIKLQFMFLEIQSIIWEKLHKKTTCNQGFNERNIHLKDMNELVNMKRHKVERDCKNIYNRKIIFLIKQNQGPTRD